MAHDCRSPLSSTTAPPLPRAKQGALRGGPPARRSCSRLGTRHIGQRKSNEQRPTHPLPPTTATATGHHTALSPADTDTPSLRHFNQMQFFVDLCILVFKSVKSTNKRSKPKALLFLTAH